jgi:hypothetical protein
MFLWTNIRTAMSVAPWLDEVAQIDAGVNLYLGNGWLSTTWPSQSQSQFWAGNNPLYALLVYCWLTIFGFSPVVVRSLNYVLVLVIAWLIVDACRRARLIQSKWVGILLAILLICNQSVTLVYRSGRADLVTMATLASLFWIYISVQHPLRRKVLLFLCATLILPSGIHAIPYLVLLVGLDYICCRKLRTRDLTAIGVGCLAGGFAMAVLFLWKHALRTFVSQTFASGYNMAGSGLQAAMIHDNAATKRLLVQLRRLSPDSVLQIIAQDTSALILILVLLFLLIRAWRVKQSKIRFIALMGVVSAIAIPYGMLVAGRYAPYYAWMGAAPTTVAFAMCLEACWLTGKRLLVAGSLVAAAASILLGMPSDVWRQVHTTDPTDYGKLQELLRNETRPGDTVYGGPILYYAAKSSNIPFVSTSYAGGRGYRHMTDGERSRVSILILQPNEIDESFQKLGGRWTRRLTYQMPYGTSLVVYRRSPGLQSQPFHEAGPAADVASDARL